MEGRENLRESSSENVLPTPTFDLKYLREKQNHLFGNFFLMTRF